MKKLFEKIKNCIVTNITIKDAIVMLFVLIIWQFIWLTCITIYFNNKIAILQHGIDAAIASTVAPMDGE